MNWCLWVSPNLLLLICSNLKPNTHVKMRAEKGPKIIDLFRGLSFKIPCDMSQKKEITKCGIYLFLFPTSLCCITTFRYMILGHKNSFLLLLLLILLGIEHSTFCDTFITYFMILLTYFHHISNLSELWLDFYRDQCKWRFFFESDKI